MASSAALTGTIPPTHFVSARKIGLHDALTLLRNPGLILNEEAIGLAVVVG